jgi:NAD(P)-dependent dehydrogenase (short-subunit alcohol dehydrogenase family)
MSLFEQFRLDGQTAVVTGGSRGLGRQMAGGLAEAGADVAIPDVAGERAETAAAEIADEHGVATTATETDVTETDDVAAMAETVADELGPVDVLVNNAGIVENAPAEEMTGEEWGSVIDVNLTGVFNCAREIGGRMLDRGAAGRIVNVASVAGRIVPHPQPQASYNASKAGVYGLTRSLASEWATEGIRVNAVGPGYMRTDLVDDVLTADPEMEEAWLDATPAERLGRPEELRAVVVFLASEASSFVTGEVVFVDGGLSVR